ncbi:MAG TPA: serine/threonine-protein kinase [Polyangiales bacterium]|nr:serine/threonine-protein kinase [Polyangiales bacterium]
MQPALQDLEPTVVLPAVADAGDWRQTRLGSWLGASHRVLKPLSSGAYGHVYLAEHVALGTLVAAKFSLPSQPLAASVLRQEASVLARLAHSNIVGYRKFGLADEGGAYLLMEYARGIELESWLAQHGPMPAERALGVLEQLAAAVDYLHAHDHVHADLKPTHVMLDEARGDRIKLLDFGCAFDCRDSRQSRDVAGTPGYMAPEQARGEQCGPAIDIYALAALASELLTGSLPHTHTTRSVMRAVLCEPPTLPSARGLSRPGLDACFARALHKKPHERFATAGEFVDAIRLAFAS